MAAYQRSARSGQSTSSPWGACASLDQAACDALLETKRMRLASTLKAENLVAASIADAADVFGAQAAGHRHRAQFARSGDELPVRLCQFDAKLREQVAVDASLPVLSAGRFELSVLSAAAINGVLMVNHRPGRYIGH